LYCCSFRQYASLVEAELMPKFNAVEHWAKIEVSLQGQLTICKMWERAGWAIEAGSMVL
jgi:hypothetical protein